MVDVVTLVSYEVIEYDNIGNPIEREIIRDTYCTIKSVTMTEFYRAQEQKIGVKYCLEVNAFDYKGESHVYYKGKKHKVIRTFTKGDKLELYCGD